MDVVDVGALMAAVRARVPATPLDRVEAAVVAGKELASSGDELIGRFVAEAREAGCSWTEIGARLGVSKQAARQRFAQPEVPAPGGLAPGGRLKPTERLLACLQAAGREAAADGAAEIGAHHLLIGLFEEGVAAAILEKLGLRAAAVRAAARELFPGAAPPAQLPPPESAEACDAIRGAEAQARRGGCGSVGTEHLLGALALDPGSRARRVLISLPVSIPAIKKELECYISPGRPRRRGRGKAAAGACSFCGKPGGAGLRLIAGPGVHICAECIGLCNEILARDADDAGGNQP
jgi:ClpX C4-type zinc finger/Clp amino terminal domain, pathogenicity island component